MVEDSYASDDNPEAHRFRHPPTQITRGCAAYMDRVHELREFISAFFSMVKSFEPLTAAVQKTAPEKLSKLRQRTIPALYNYSVHRQFLNELVLSRTVETFDLYVLTTLRAIFRARPEMLKSESPIAVATIVELRNFEDVLTYIAERRLHELSFKPLSELDKFIRSRTGIPLFGTPEVYRTALIASEVRNLVAHNDCLVSDLFRNRVGDTLPEEDIFASGKFNISDRWMREASYVLDGVVFDFDSQVSAKFGIPTIDSREFKGSRVGVESSLEAIQIVSEGDASM
jgi:hypothetical protein